MAFPVSEDKIAEAETALQRRLPDRLRARLLQNNGGDLVADDDDWVLHPIRDDSDRKRLARTASHIVKETEAARRWLGFPPEGIAVASDGSGDLLVILPESDDLLLWSHETGALTRARVEWD